LETLFGRSVDVITERSIRNPYFRQAVEASRQPIDDGETARRQDGQSR
jgi:predicted nucleotidyltransferase